MMKIAAVGSEAFVLGFRLAGVNDVFAARPENIESAIRAAITGDRFGILIVHEEEVKFVSEAMKETMLRSIRPVIIKIGGGRGIEEQSESGDWGGPICIQLIRLQR
jgi:V/A-type H+-transporting ATPase subunit F